MSTFDLTDFDAFIFDLDGTIWLSGTVMPGVLDFLERCRANDSAIVFASNLSIPHHDHVVNELRSVGVATESDGVVTSAISIAASIAEAGVREAVVVTGPGTKAAIAENGIQVRDALAIDIDEWLDAPEHRACVIAGWPGATMDELNAVGFLAANGIPLYIATLDPGLPIARGFEPGTGMMVSAIRALYDVDVIITGKPSPMFAQMVRRHMPAAQRPLMVGDSRTSDIGLAELLTCESLFLTRGKDPSSVVPVTGLPTPTFAATGLDDPNPVRVSST